MEGHAETEDWEAMDIFESILIISKLYLEEIMRYISLNILYDN